MSAQPMPRWGMVIDLNRCVGCQTCTIACKHANDTLPGVQWRRVLDVESGTYPDVERLFLVVGCQHCAEPPCVPVCPTGATFQRADGLVAMRYDRCIGCGYCAVACPYQARTIAHERQWYFGSETRQEKAAEKPERIGVAQKCSFCIERIDEAEAHGLTPGLDLDVTPACSASCIAQAIHFGDLNDPESEVARLGAEQASFQMHAELGTDPQIRYLYETPAVPGREADAGEEEDDDDDWRSDPTNPLVGSPQRFWDLRAATNFTLGGLGSGLTVMAYLAYLVEAFPAHTLTHLYTAAAAVMSCGLFAVFLEIARKARFLYALLRPQSSWMTREVYCVAVLFPAIAAEWLWPHAALRLLAAVAAFAFLYCQARILHAGRGIPAWRVPLMPWMLVASGLFEGTGALAVASLLPPVQASTLSAAAGVVLALVNASLWHAYRESAAARGIGPLARRTLDDVTPWLHGIGHGLPFVLFALAIETSGLHPVLSALGGVAAIAGGALWKITVITRASHQQGFALPKLPQRGSGARAAPRRTAGAGSAEVGVTRRPGVQA